MRWARLAAAALLPLCGACAREEAPQSGVVLEWQGDRPLVHGAPREGLVAAGGAGVGRFRRDGRCLVVEVAGARWTPVLPPGVRIGESGLAFGGREVPFGKPVSLLDIALDAEVPEVIARPVGAAGCPARFAAFLGLEPVTAPPRAG